MADWISFEASVVAMEWGESVYTVLPLPDEVTAELAAQGTKRVEIELNDRPFNMALTKAPVLDQAFVYTGKNVLKEAGIEPGEVLDVRLRKTDPNVVETPQDVALALAQNDLTATWSATTPGQKRAHLHQITSAKRDQTRISRIAKLILLLKQG